MLRDILLDWILFGIVESFVIINFIVPKYHWGNKNFHRFLSLVVLFSILNTIICHLTDGTTLLLLKHIWVITVIPISIAKIYHKDVLTTIIMCSIMYGSMFILEASCVFIIEEILHMDYIGLKIFNKFLALLPIKILEIIISYKDVNIMKLIFGSIERR